MNEIYMNVSITYYGNENIRCSYCESIGDEPVRMTKLELDKARRMIWELVLAGGKRTVSTNWYNPEIYTVDAYVFLPG